MRTCVRYCIAHSKSVCVIAIALLNTDHLCLLIAVQVDTPKPNISKVYWWSTLLLEEMKKLTLTTARKNVVLRLTEHRRTQLLTDFHIACHALDPEYLTYDRSDCTPALMTMMEKLAETPGVSACVHFCVCLHCACVLK